MKKLVICFLTCALLSCNDEHDDVMYLDDAKSELPLTDLNSSSTLSDVVVGSSSQTRSSFSNENPISANSTTRMQGTGYTKTKILASKQKCSYPGSSPIMLATGLAGGIYFVDAILVSKTLNANQPGDMIAPITSVADDKDMGLKNFGFFNTEIGWNPSEIPENGDGIFEGQTYLLHFTYNLLGEKLDKYYPCHPEKIVWKYNSVTLE